MSKDQYVLVGSSLSLIIPTIVSSVRQPMPVTILLLLTTTFSVLFHTHYERRFAQEDMIFAFLTLLMSAVAYVLLSWKLGWLHWKVVLVKLLSILGFSMYLTKGSRGHDAHESDRDDDYDVFHGIWHISGSLAILILVLQDIPWKMAGRLTIWDCLVTGWKRENQLL